MHAIIIVQEGFCLVFFFVSAPFPPLRLPPRRPPPPPTLSRLTFLPVFYQPKQDRRRNRSIALLHFISTFYTDCLLCSLAHFAQTQVSKATSFFSLAPLRYSAEGPPFEPARCLTNGNAADRSRRAYARERRAYQRGTWGRQWLVWLVLWMGALFFVMAATLLAAGRQLQHKCVAVCLLCV